MMINISEILTTPSIIREYTAEPDSDRIKLRRTSYKVAHHEPFLLKVAREDKKLRITGDTEMTLIMPCDRCLEDVSVTIPVNIDRQIDLDSLKDGNQDVDEVSFMDGCMLDADILVKDEIVVALPTKILCKEDCRGLCPQCGANLNKESCDCQTDHGDPRMAAIRDIFRDYNG